MFNLRLTSLILSLMASCGFAGTLSYEVTGTFAGTFPSMSPSMSSSISPSFNPPPDIPFKLTFELPEQPTPIELTPSSFKVLADLRFTLDTEPAFDIANAPIWFYDSTGLGMFDVEVSSTSIPDVYDLSPFGLAMFSGTLDQPTMLAGTFFADPSTSKYSLNGNAIAVSDLAVQVQTPEPVTGLLAGVVLLGLGVLRRRVR